MNMEGKKFHIIGICGMGMSAIAQYLKQAGNIVQGSDNTNCEMATYLLSQGIIVLPHCVTNITYDINYIIVSSAINKNDLELLKGSRLQISVLSRKDILSEITKQSGRVISVAGAHGKTTITTMAAELFCNLNEDPTIFAGGIMHFCNSNFKNGNIDLMLVEADESDGTFMNLKTDIAVLANIDFEHVEYYRDLPHLIKSCEFFLNRKNMYKVVVNGDDKLIQKLNLNMKPFTYGFDNSNDIYAKDINDDSFTIVIRNTEITNVQLKAPGKHNILNALCALSIAFVIQENTDDVINAALKMMKNYLGVKRRFNVLKNDDLMIIDDYAHHPTEIVATIKSVYDKKERRLIGICEPHRFTRLNAFMNNFISCFDECDIIIITSVYAAGEKPIKNVTADFLVEQIQSRIDSTINIRLKKVYYCETQDDIFTTLNDIKLKNDIMLFMGAGTISSIVHEYTNTLNSI